jgi:DNA mismatch repair ATPase MutL
MLSADRLLWNLMRTFWEGRFAIFESNMGLIFIDLSAVQQCILLYKFWRNNGNLPLLLLMPSVITVDGERTAAIDAALEWFTILALKLKGLVQNT